MALPQRDLVLRMVRAGVFLACVPPAVLLGQQPASDTQTAQYVGSKRCQQCHNEIYGRWIKTRMANVVRDPKEHPDAIIPDLTKPSPLVTFKKEDIAFVYGSKWKQRYFTKRGDDYFPLGAQWDVINQVWRAYNVAPNTDWWTEHYPKENSGRPTGPLCDGCHSVNYNLKTKQVTEWNVGCEKCHGPGSVHAARPSRTNIINPARLDHIAGNDTCIQCHSEGRPLQPEAEGKMWAWPIGFNQGQRLSDFWKFEEFKPGEQSFTHFADGSGHKNRMQGNDFAQSVMYTRGVTCFSCHDVHGTSNNADLIKPANVVCLTCHGPSSPNGPHGVATLEQHTHHAANSLGNECVSCHMPKIAQQIADINVRSHTFKFISPSETEKLKVPNSCTSSCHADKNPAWALDQLKNWRDVSPWRVNQ
jgi:predicted CXXCH cytochrome family protein